MSNYRLDSLPCRRELLSCSLKHVQGLHTLALHICLLIIMLAQVMVKDRIGWTPLHFGASNGHMSVCKLLVMKRASCSSQDKVDPHWSKIVYFIVRRYCR